jgi:CspA family cold shock protein
MPGTSILQGRVTEFDEPRGWGTVEAGGREYPFHCTQIADGTRTIDVGTEVAFAVEPAFGGRWEARAVTRRA